MIRFCFFAFLFFEYIQSYLSDVFFINIRFVWRVHSLKSVRTSFSHILTDHSVIFSILSFVTMELFSQLFQSFPVSLSDKLQVSFISTIFGYDTFNISTEYGVLILDVHLYFMIYLINFFKKLCILFSQTFNFFFEKFSLLS